MKADVSCRESLQAEAEVDPMDGEQTWPTETELLEAEGAETKSVLLGWRWTSFFFSFFFIYFPHSSCGISAHKKRPSLFSFGISHRLKGDGRTSHQCDFPVYHNWCQSRRIHFTDPDVLQPQCEWCMASKWQIRARLKQVCGHKAQKESELPFYKLPYRTVWSLFWSQEFCLFIGSRNLKDSSGLNLSSDWSERMQIG